MQIGAVSFRPYIYNASVVNAGSLSRVSSIGDDLTSGRTDFSALSDESLNENPLKKGQTVNFSDVLERQMWEGRRNASRIMKPDEVMENLEEAGEAFNDSDAAETAGRTKNPEEAQVRAAAAGIRNSARELGASEVREDFKPVSALDSAAKSAANGIADEREQMFSAQPERNLFQIQRAIEAYQMNMTA